MDDASRADSVKLQGLGFGPFFSERLADLVSPGERPARITAIDRGGGLVRSEEGEAPFELAGKLEFSTASPADLPTVGDWVSARYHNDGALAIVHAVFPRRTFLRRKRAGRDVDFQMVAANIDCAFVVSSCEYDFNLHRLDRYLVMAADGGIEPVVVLTKTDLVPATKAQEMVQAVHEAGIRARVLALSATTGDGFEDFVRLLAPGRTYCLLGSSGVGKTTLLNRLLGSEAFDTRAVSATGEGVHTTARRQLVVLDGGAMLIDTPGMRELGLMGAGDAVEGGFSVIADLAAGCRFADCSHTHELGCAVRAAVEEGGLDRDRYEHYLKIRKESEFNEMSYAERRKKDRAFGRFVKSAKRTLKE